MHGRDSFWHRIDQQIPSLAFRYFRLLLVVGPSRSGKTRALRQLARERGLPVINVNLRLSERLLDVTSRRRPLEVQRILSEVVAEQGSQTLLLDNTEILFHPGLKLDPLRLLQQLARNQSVVATWAGNFDGECLTYAVPGHAESKRCENPDAMIVSARRVHLYQQGPPMPSAITEVM